MPIGRASASAEDAHVRDMRSRGMKPKLPLQPCGTKAAYQRHSAHGERACVACRAANNERSKRQQAVRSSMVSDDDGSVDSEDEMTLGGGWPAVELAVTTPSYNSMSRYLLTEADNHVFVVEYTAVYTKFDADIASQTVRSLLISASPAPAPPNSDVEVRTTIAPDTLSEQAGGTNWTDGTWDGILVGADANLPASIEISEAGSSVELSIEGEDCSGPLQPTGVSTGEYREYRWARCDERSIQVQSLPSGFAVDIFDPSGNRTGAGILGRRT
jgi:hypothetical protein